MSDWPFNKRVGKKLDWIELKHSPFNQSCVQKRREQDSQTATFPIHTNECSRQSLHFMSCTSFHLRPLALLCYNQLLLTLQGFLCMVIPTNQHSQNSTAPTRPACLGSIQATRVDEQPHWQTPTSARKPIASCVFNKKKKRHTDVRAYTVIHPTSPAQGSLRPRTRAVVSGNVPTPGRANVNRPKSPYLL